MPDTVMVATSMGVDPRASTEKLCTNTWVASKATLRAIIHEGDWEQFKRSAPRVPQPAAHGRGAIGASGERL